MDFCRVDYNHKKMKRIPKKRDFSYRQLKSLVSWNLPISIESIDLSHNDLENLEDVEWPPNLLYLNLGCNKLTTWKGLPPSLLKLNMAGNPLYSRTPYEILALEHCPLAEGITLPDGRYLNLHPYREKIYRVSRMVIMLQADLLPADLLRKIHMY